MVNHVNVQMRRSTSSVQVWVQHIVLHRGTQTRRERRPEIRNDLIELIELGRSRRLFKVRRFERRVLWREHRGLRWVVKSPPEAQVEGLHSRKENGGLCVEYERIRLIDRVFVQQIRGI